MGNLDQARETQLRNIEARTGRKLPELRTLISSSGLKKHGEIRSMLMKQLKLGYGGGSPRKSPAACASTRSSSPTPRRSTPN
jgi:hypothetical protein